MLPSTLTGHTKTGMCHEDDHAPLRTQHPGRRRQCTLKRIHILNAQKEDDRIKLLRMERIYIAQVAHITAQETPMYRVTLLCQGQQARTDFNACITCVCLGDIGRKDTLSSSHIEEIFIRLQIEQIEDSGNGQL